MTKTLTSPPEPVSGRSTPSFGGLEAVPSPALLFDPQAIRRNLARMLAMVEGRLRWPEALGGDTVAEPHAVAALGALSFLVKDLETHVGDSGRPVVVMGHTGFDSDWWHYEDKTAFYEALRGYRVLAYLYGHTGTGVKPWRPRPEAPLLDCLNTGQTTRGFYVLEISSDRFRAAYRQRRDGEWSWAHTLDRPLADPLPVDQGPAPEPWPVGGDQPVADPGAAVFVRIGAPGNPPDQRLDPPAYSPDGIGSVGHEFELAAHPVTAAHYAAFQGWEPLHSH